MTSSASRSAISSQVAASGPSQLDLLDGLMTSPCGLGVAPVSRSRPPVKGKEPMIQGICGRTFIASFAEDGPLSSWESRLRARLATVGSTESALIWRRKDTPQGRSISRLAVSTRHTNGTGFTGQESTRSTPRASDGQLAQNASYHPTPLSLSFKDSHQPGTNRTLEMMKAYMPTPKSSNAGPDFAKEDRSKTGLSLQTVMAATALTGQTRNGSDAMTTKRGAPNPVFAFWLMGFPDEWISGALVAMQSYRKPRRK